MTGLNVRDTLGSTLASCLHALTEVSDDFGQLERSLREEGVPIELDLPTSDVGAFRFALRLQSNSLLSKFEGLQGPQTYQAAVKKWFEAEEQCHRTGYRFCHLKVGRGSNDVEFALSKARSICQRILGKFDLDEMVRLADFGPGANIGHRKSEGHVVEKIAGKATVTGTCLPYLEAYRVYDPLLNWGIGQVEVVKGNEAFTVPKNAKSDRFCAKEPLWNMFFQKGIGGMIRRRLAKVGLDLDNQQPINQALARRGSETGLLATEDLKSASDTLCTSLVRYMVDDEWFYHMNNVRSHWTRIEDKDVLVRKMASMGNGFAFELETVIFLSLALAVCRLPIGSINRLVAVYGDDIIVPSDCVVDLRELFSFCGLTSNPDKSFYLGLFRESCGGQFYAGQDVTPFYVKKKVSSLSQRLVLYNQICRWAARLNDGFGKAAEVERVAGEVLAFIPERDRLPIPDGVGDGGVLMDFDLALPKKAASHKRFRGWEGWVYYQRVPIAVELKKLRSRRYHFSALCHKLWTVRRGGDFSPGYRFPIRYGSQEPKDLLRSLEKAGRVRWATVPSVAEQWVSLGPWTTLLRGAETGP